MTEFIFQYVDGKSETGTWTAGRGDGIERIISSAGTIRGHGIYFFDGVTLGGGTVSDAYGAGVEFLDLESGKRLWGETFPDLRHDQVKLGAWRPGTAPEYTERKRQRGEVWQRWYICCTLCGAICTASKGRPSGAMRCGWCGEIFRV